MDRMIVAGRTEVMIGAGLPSPLLPANRARRNVLVLTQPAATGRAMAIADRLRSEALNTEVMGLPDRDQAKTIQVVSSVYLAMSDMRMTLDDTVVGVGGGSVTDVAGFVAGTWMRGIEVVHFPTTFLASIDAAVGGKTGINVGGKNLVGVFWHPTRVVVDTGILSTLPGSLVREGLAEAVKAGLVGDPDLVALFETNGSEAPTEEVVRRSLSVKASLVDLDPLDRGERAFLNFGHTIGHAVEYASTLSHGESVSLGMVAAAHVSAELEGFPDLLRVVRILERLDLPVAVEGIDRTRVLDLVGRDKKRNAEGVRMVLLRGVGDPVLRPVAPAHIEAALDAIGVQGR
jgi:3-dehydroquinate synthase